MAAATVSAVTGAKSRHRNLARGLLIFSAFRDFIAFHPGDPRCRMANK